MGGDRRAVLDVRIPEPDDTLRYGDAPDEVYDAFFSTAGGLSPLVIVLHGGFWRSEFDRRHLRAMAGALTRSGAHVVTPEFRRSGGLDGGWPGTFADVARAVDELLTSFAPTGPVVLAGHSSGGHLALWSAGRHLLPRDAPGYRDAPLPIARVVALAPITALGTARRDLPPLADPTSIRDLLGGDPTDVPDRYAAAEPATSTCIPVTLLHGTADDRVPIADSRAYAESSRTAGDDITLTELPATDHFALIDPTSPAWPTVSAAIVR